MHSVRHPLERDQHAMHEERVDGPSIRGGPVACELAAACVDRALAALADAGLAGHLPAIARWVAGRTN